MARPRQNVKVATILERGNHYLRESDDRNQRERLAVAGFMETLLHDADAYAGFTYTAAAGVNYAAIERGDGFECEDESRRVYHRHSSLSFKP